MPVRLTVQDVSPGAVAFPLALHAIAAADVNAPWAVPVSLRSPAHVAVNEPRADAPVCSVTFHLKSVQVLGVGISEDDVQLPSNELLPPADGEVSELSRSTLVHAAALRNTEKLMRRSRFFIWLFVIVIGHTAPWE